MRRLDTFQNKSDTPLLVGPNNYISQSFVPRHNNLAGIRITVFNPKLGGDGTYTMTILDQNNQTVRQQFVKESNLGWEQSFRYDFDPIDGSNNNKFTIIISYLGENEDGVLISTINLQRLGKSDKFLISDVVDRIQKNYLGVGYSSSSSYSEGEAFIGGEPVDGDLAFQLYYKTSLLGFAKDSLTEFTYRAKNDKSFFIFYFLLLTILIYLLFYRILKKRT